MKQEQNAGFWVRFAALWIDTSFIYLLVTAAVGLSELYNLYLPFEFCVFAGLMIYSVILIGWQGKTFGKAVCGLSVRTAHNEQAGYIRTFLREVIGKFVSGIILFLGFIWVTFSQSKQGWHDRIARTIVVQQLHARQRARIALIVTLVISACFAYGKAYEIIALYVDIQQVALPSGVKDHYEDRDLSSLVEVSSLLPEVDDQFSSWLDDFGDDPIDYAVKTAAKHEVTIFGETHEQKDYLLFLNKIIPALYDRAGVTCIALEVCTAENNEKIQQLITSPEYDRGLALRIAREQPWGLWGWKEYWDVFETVWQLNQNIPNDRKKMRLVGLDMRWDAPSMGLLGAESGERRSPLVEKLRIFRLWDDFARFFKRDEFMARQVEKEILEKGERGIVWVGANHSYTHYRQKIIIGGKLIKVWGRMGFLLHQKYRDKVFQILLHKRDLSPSLVDSKYRGPDPEMSRYIERVMAKRGNTPVGFNVSDSPFAVLRDSCSYTFYSQPAASFSDAARGFIFLKPVRKLKHCGWLPEYVSDEMFVKNKPFYQSFAERHNLELKSAQDVNDFFSQVSQ